jgi:acyl-coenzyme A synthetase/AMP-(fatty) acid ligase
MRVFAPDTFCLVDGPSNIDLPQFHYVEPDTRAFDLATAFAIPCIPAQRILAYVFTSGSTGVPVPHKKNWGPMVRNVRAQAVALSIGSGAGVLATVPPQHMYGLESSVLLPLQSGGVLSAHHPFYPADICDALAQIPLPRLLVTTPLHLRALLETDLHIPSVDLVLSATAPLSLELAKSVEDRLVAPLLEIYGCTETGQIATRRSTQTRYWSLFPSIKLMQRGEHFWAWGGHVEQETALSDALELAVEGRFLLHGRIGDLVNIAGKRNSLAHLNHQLQAISGVLDAAFFMPEDEAQDGVTRLAAFVVAPELNMTQLQAALRARIDPVFMPRPLVRVDVLPRNSTGKLTRATIQALAKAHLNQAETKRRMNK